MVVGDGESDGSGPDQYFPDPEAEGGWRYADSGEEIRERAKLDPKVLELANREQEWYYGGDSWSISIIRNGVLASEFRSFDALDSSLFEVFSFTLIVPPTSLYPKDTL
jgi:hypothetical protein